jgi:hypothetical protein
MSPLQKGAKVKDFRVKFLLVLRHSVGLFLATFFAGTGVGAIVTNGNWMLGSLIGVGTAFAGVLTYVGVSLAWTGELQEDAIRNAFRAAVAKQENENIQDALRVERDGNFDWDDLDDHDPELADPNDAPRQ